LSDRQILVVLKQAEPGVKVRDLCRERSLSSATGYGWRSGFGGMDYSMMRRFTELEDDDRRQRMIYAEGRLKSDFR